MESGDITSMVIGNYQYVSNIYKCVHHSKSEKPIHYISIAIYTMVNPNSNVSTHAIDIVIC